MADPKGKIFSENPKNNKSSAKPVPQNFRIKFVCKTAVMEFAHA
jgi:hypothetical protein